jgi:hypothetical protein
MPVIDLFAHAPADLSAVNRGKASDFAGFTDRQPGPGDIPRTKNSPAI